MGDLIIGLIISVCVIEISLKLVIDYLSSQFPWILTKKSEVPEISDVILEKYKRSSHDPVLGWVRKANSYGIENIGNRLTQYSIDSSGSRTICNSHDKRIISTFGDSFAFCRQVNDNETWQYFLGQMLNVGVNNFGVGNYGLDQALLRYETIQALEQTEIVIMCFVPETIARIQSVWKHYFEHGNTLAFKPRYSSRNGELILTPNFLATTNRYHELGSKKIRGMLQSSDKFYKSKFRKYQFRFPYSFHLLRNPIRQLRLVSRVFGNLWKSSKIDVRVRFSCAWNQIISENIRIAQDLYADKQSTDLMTHLLRRFCQIAEDRGHIPLIVVIPQLGDLLSHSKQRKLYTRYFEERCKEVNLIDLSSHIERNLDKELFDKEIGGGHLTLQGNQLVAELIKKQIESIVTSKG